MCEPWYEFMDRLRINDWDDEGRYGSILTYEGKQLLELIREHLNEESN